MTAEDVVGAGIALRILGGFGVWIGGHTVALPSNSQRVLGYLAVTCAEARRDVLAGRLWGWTSQARAQANLRTALWRIRRASPTLVAGRRYVVRIGTDVDVDFPQMMAQAHRLIDSPSASTDLLATPLRLLEGDLLPGWDEDWLLVDRERHRQLRMHALEALSRHLVESGEYGRAVDAAYAAIAVEPLYESAHAALIRAHLAEGNRTEAIRQFTAFRRMLYDETGLAPSPRLVAVLQSAIGDVPGPRVAPRQRLADPSSLDLRTRLQGSRAD
jgi:DNA-binding SARP family transcriptional activator